MSDKIKPVVSAIICTHNPRFDYLDRVIDGLKTQNLPYSEWEFLLVDNASDKLLSNEVDLSWQPNSRYIREDKLGLTSARLRGIKEAKTELLVFIDDDNVIDQDYLEVALQISREFPFLGAWGGQIIGEFETQPPAWAKRFFSYLAIREFDQDRWSNLLHQLDTTPFGAGMCVRKNVANQYANSIKTDKRRLELDRKGNDLQRVIPFSCGDIDLAFTACDMGLGTGLFTSLKLTHLISSNRVTEEYLLRLFEGSTYSQLILDSYRGKLPQINRSWKQKIREFYGYWNINPIQRRFYRAGKRATRLATQEILGH
ncbi:glycosyl transferase family 2 [Crinalium epipsammum PCC 9333]|uniref:Glycosyl transferase family 2 n=1 Tax=Crinalium epipsammum PCC 9333 TaxID=1173022 RepID=K9W2I5_9CYAN|nr:glycosyltransferase [Crinalium epipsammum]AFZ13620.1 glycosyl transferase family 2 [Crinalium epipsammum PCC 9333]